MNQHLKGFAMLAITAILSLQLNSKCQAQGEEIFTKLASMKTSLSYFGNNGIRPGLSKRSEINLTSNEKTKESRRFWLGSKYQRSHTKEWFYTQNDAIYWHPRSHVGLIKNWGTVYRKTRTKGHEFEVGFYPLGLQIFAVGETYEVSNNGSIEKKNLSLSWHYTPGISIGYGKLLSKQSGAIDAWHMRLAINGVMNYNNAIVPMANLELGLRFHTIKLMSLGK